MKENECRTTLLTALKWRCAAFCIWSAPIIYFILSISHVLILEPPTPPSTYMFFRFYVLCQILMLCKYLTLSNFPDVSSSQDELRKLFTSISPFHLLIIVSSVLYHMLFKELGMVFGYYRPMTAWGSFFASGLGIMAALAFLLRHEYITYWFDPPIPRVQWALTRFPDSIIKSLAVNSVLIIVLNVLWLIAKYEIAGFEYWGYGVTLYFTDYFLSRIMQNFLATYTKLDEENHLGEELAICGLLLKDTDTHFFCLQDLNCASDSRKAHIMDPKSTQWPILLESCLLYIHKVTRHIQNYSTLKLKDKNVKPIKSGDSFVVTAANWIYFLFNEPFACKFRNELFKSFTMAALSSKVLTNFITSSGASHVILKDNSLSSVINAQAESLVELEKYKKIDEEIMDIQFKENVITNLKQIKMVYSEYLTSIPLRGEALQMLHNIG